MRSEQGRFREELGLSARAPAADSLVAWAREAGFQRAGIVNPALLAPWAARLRGLEGRGLPRRRDPGAGDAVEWDWVLDPQRWVRSSTLMVCCLSCHTGESDDLSTPGDPHGLIAPFARANYYRAAMNGLRSLARRIAAELGLSRGSIRLFCNSRLPEKALLAGAGIGTYGKNGLAIVPGLGSLFVIGGAVIPVPTDTKRLLAEPVRDPCGSCARCMEACPVGAIVSPGVVDRDRCLQGAAGTAEALAPEVMKKWGARLYGCQDCQDACPHNSGVSFAGAEAGTFAAAPGGILPGVLGPSVSLRWVLSHDAAGLKQRLRATALGMSWISGESLLRNALVAAGNRGDPALRPAVERLAQNQSPLLRQAARWALEQLPIAMGL